MSQEEIDFVNFEIDKIKESSQILTWDSGVPESYEPTPTETHKIIQNKNLGKIQFDINIPDSLLEKLKNLSTSLGYPPVFHRAAYTEYSTEWGDPKLNKHIDMAEIFMVDYQLSSNTTWGLLVGDNQYDLKDNEAIAFCPKRQVHGRTTKVFEDGEYIKMLFLEMLLEEDSYPQVIQ